MSRTPNEAAGKLACRQKSAVASQVCGAAVVVVGSEAAGSEQHSQQGCKLARFRQSFHEVAGEQHHHEVSSKRAFRWREGLREAATE